MTAQDVTAKELFAGRAFALALASLGITLKPKTVVSLYRVAGELRCFVTDPDSPENCIADGGFFGDEDGGEIKINWMNNRELSQAPSRWFTAVGDIGEPGRPVPMDEVMEEEEVAVAEPA